MIVSLALIIVISVSSNRFLYPQQAYAYISLSRGQEDEHHCLINDGYNNSDRVGFLLDMDNGTLALYKIEDHIGEIASGFVGDYVWIATCLSNSLGDGYTSVRYE